MALERNASPSEDGFTTTTAAECRQPPENATRFQTEVLAMLGEMRSGMHSMSGRISELEHDRTQSAPPSSHTPKGKGKAPRRRSVERDASSTGAGATSGGDTPECSHDVIDREERAFSVTSDRTTRSRHWADRDDEVMDYDAELVWDDEDDEPPDSKGAKLFKIGERIVKFLATACPTLDKVIKGRLPAATKSRDRQLAKQQALMLDAVGPITHILEEVVKGQLTHKCAIEATQTALRLLGNASVHSCYERRKNDLQSMNTRLLDMADDDVVYKSAPPLLFGDGFCKKAKERDEELKCLNMATAKASGAPRETQFFF